MKINLLSENLNWKKNLQEGFDTEKLIFRAFSGDELKPVLEISSDNELFTYVDDINNCDDLEHWFKSVYQKKNYLFFTIKRAEYFENKEGLLGILMLNKIEFNVIELGGWIGKESRGKGYGRETVAGLVKYIKQKLPDTQLCAKTREDNSAGLRVLDTDGIERKINRCHGDNDSD